MTIGTLILRVVLGTIFIGHGTQKLFGWWHGGGLRGTAAMFDRTGFRPSEPLAIVGGATETIGGILLVLGFLTPFGSAAVIGMMVTAAVAVHLPNGMWNTKGGVEFPMMNAAAAAALAFIGPGRISVDRLLRWHLRGTSWGVFALVLGIGSAALVLGWRSVQLQLTGAHAAGDGQQQPPRAA